MWALKEGENSVTLPTSNTALPASPPAPTGLTPNPSPRGEGSDMPCALTTCCWLTYYLPASPHSLLASTTPYRPHPQPLSKGRGE